MESIMLIVDDQEINREVLKVLFRDRYEILEADDGAEALAVLESCQGNVDIVLLDLIMPKVAGFEVLQRRKELDFFRDVPVVVITGSGALEDQIKAFDLGANDYINKPFVPEIVISRVDNVMASHRRMMSIELEARKLRIKSELDQMTGLYNKTTIELMINETLKNAIGKQNVLFVIDIDNFKSVNDTSGHLTGDHVIRIVADLLSSLFRKSDLIGRIGGDEFVALMVDIPDMDIARFKVTELIQIMKYKPNLTIPENVSLSIGIAASDGKAVNYTDLFKHADEALDIAKKGGKARYHEYGSEDQDLSEDSRPVGLLISRNRGVCSTILAHAPAKLRMVEALELEELAHVADYDRDKLALIVADISDLEDSAYFWEELRAYEWIHFPDIIAVCREGDTSQLAAALSQGVGDVMTEPVDSAAFKRRVMKLLGKMGITEDKPNEDHKQR